MFNVGDTFIPDFVVLESVILSYSFQSLKKAGTSTRVPENVTTTDY